MNQAKSLITKNTKIVSVVHVSNAIGTINPIKEIIDLAHNAGAISIIDAAQSVPHMTIDVKKLDCDFLVFSGHKMLGPTGIGVLYGKRTLLENMQPFLYGGNMIREVKLETSTWADLPEKFEAGTPNISGVIGLAAAINYLTRIGMNSIESYEKELLNYASEQLSTIKGITIYGPKDERSCVLSFNVDGIHPHDISTLLDREGVAVRGGHHCTMPLMKVLDLTGTVRASFYFYNTFEEVDGLVKAIIQAKQVFGYDS
jgi:cysteine desulfurase/selenocysteine lyase